MNFKRFSDTQIATLHRIAKAKNKGVRPFFRRPRLMIALREEHEARQTSADKKVKD